jgi:phosphoserine phosphatase RsbU/P
VKALIVDDDEQLRFALSKVMAQQGFAVTTVADGSRALAVLEEEPHPVVLTDCLMPEMNGLDLVRAIRERQTDGYTYVIMLTGWNEVDAMRRGMEAGVDDFLVKPARAEELVARLNVARRIMALQEDLVCANRTLLEQNSTLGLFERRMKAELRTAAQVQRSLLPSELPHISGIRIGWRLRPAVELAGDFLNIHVLDDSTIGVFVVDVSGHGVSAALLAAQVSRVLSSELVRTCRAWQPAADRPVDQALAPSRIMAELSRLFPSTSTAPKYFTAIYGLFDVERRELRFSSAGHPGPVHLPRAGRPRQLELEGTPIGLLDNGRWGEQSVPLARGDRVVFISDGLVEGMGPAGETFEANRLLTLLHDQRGVELEPACDAVVAGLEAWCGSAAFQDDCSLLMVELS